jgi:hypothetical protein
MNKQLLLSFATIILISGFYSQNTYSQIAEFEPRYTSMDERYFVAPLEHVEFGFNGTVKLSDNPSVTILHDGEVIARAKSYEVNIYTSTKSTESIFSAYFDSQLLPKGNEYVLSLAENSVTKTDGSKNKQSKVTFTVPGDIGEATFGYEQNAVIVSTSLFSVYWDIETDPIGNPHWILYREGEKVNEYPAQVGWDFNLGQAYLDFGKKNYFEDGIHYSIVLPAGSAKSRYRDDIVNQDAILNFIGGYTEPLTTIDYTWCSLYAERPKDVLNEVSFYYNEAIKLSSNPEILLYAEGELIKSVVPILSLANEKWVLTADFGGMPLKPNLDYTIVIPEGTLLAANGDIKVNSRCTVNLNNVDSASDITFSKVQISRRGHYIHIENLDVGTPISVLSIDGKTIDKRIATMNSETISVNSSSPVIVIVNEKAYKIK